MTHGLPLFPLPRYTLFPNTLVPFHVYEPRYRRMLGDCLSGRRLLVVAALAPGWEHVPDGVAPETLPVAGLGRVLSDRRYPDGRLDLFVHGIARVRLVEARHDPWTVVDIEPLADRLEASLDGALPRLATVASRLAAALGDEGDGVRELLSSSSDPGVLSNRLAALLVDDFAERQRLLETRCPVARCDRLVSWLGEMVLRTDDFGAEAAH
ncbi:MAG: hypothetical protein EP329_09760 [Deltaproteobacteria bacterium]|nr:MAG: hypothetical protein EP329_09760 [Deltaproteobacteria bacterium]